MTSLATDEKARGPDVLCRHLPPARIRECTIITPGLVFVVRGDRSSCRIRVPVRHQACADPPLGRRHGSPDPPLTAGRPLKQAGTR
ncbi:hypothetical protein GCM10011579_021920 [Streptomyces albiflavescens]|uniref:Uncharacterized protein n=1 Tax=Streptomyces albiflavescens TaxID=1623582 RepID=A0A917XY97_9ACTN|nr:hypothetical protein GCM10011579_021920 [Streptomyces albiflavescens]